MMANLFCPASIPAKLKESMKKFNIFDKDQTFGNYMEESYESSKTPKFTLADIRDEVEQHSKLALQQ